MEAWEGRGRPGRFIFASTDMVFDGEAAAYREGDEPRPIFEYGRAKRDAEIRVLSGGGTVVRISLVYGWNPMDPRTSALLEGLRTGRFPHSYFSDEIRCPIFVDDLAEALVELAEGAAREESILHLAGPEPVSRHQFARRVAEALGLDAEIIPRARLREASLVRPADLSLDVSLACTCLATPLRGLDETLPLLAWEG
jgi:dTDP-4-dehydrorhamnose reductase